MYYHHHFTDEESEAPAILSNRPRDPWYHVSEVMGSELSIFSDWEQESLNKLFPRQCSTEVLQLPNIPANCWLHLEGSLKTREEI